MYITNPLIYLPLSGAPDESGNYKKSKMAGAFSRLP